MTNLLAWAAIGLAGSPSAPPVDAYSRAFGPRASTLISRPTLRWEIWPIGKARVTEAQMTLNGQRVQARYVPEERALVYTPPEHLEPGKYSVKCRVVIDGSLNATKEWDFTVSSYAARKLPPPSESQLRTLRAVNGVRSAMGLPGFIPDDRLNAASQAHSEYLHANNATGHYQKPGTPKFFGAAPGDRLEAYGFIQDSWEGVDYGSKSPEEAVGNLLDAPYHRIPFLQPGAPLIGSGYDGGRLALSFGTTDEVATIMYPYEGQRDVPVAWEANERPHPLRLHLKERPVVGYPIVLAHFNEDAQRIHIEAAELKDRTTGKSVPIYLNTPANDDYLRCATILMARRPLQPDTLYEVRVVGYEILETGRKGASISRTWRFTTAAH
ncbi:MAG TPA: CAP domain-containing protein [Fimbriimonadaceae bacterium]|nr:CAP domain-containing protein [Fimbriimonadaceae bacterium]